MTEPKRLLEQPGSDLDVLLLESALDEAPPSRAVDRTLVALGVASAATTGLCAGAATTAATVKSGAAGGAGLGAAGWFSSLSLAGKLGVGIAFVGAVVGVPYAATRGADPAAQEAAAPAAPGPAVVAPAAVAPAAAAADERQADATPAPVPEAIGNDAVPDGAPAAAPAPQPPPGEAPAGKPAAAKPAAAGAKPSAPAAEAKSGASPLRDEVRLLDAARAALRNGDKAAARAHLDTYAARFPNGQMKAEAQAMRAVAQD